MKIPITNKNKGIGVRKIVKKLLVTALLFAGSQCSFANVASEILPFGVFHFANPGLGKGKTTEIDVSTHENTGSHNDFSP